MPAFVVRTRSRPYNRGGTTLLELCAVLLVMSVLLAIALPRLRGAIDRAAARSAVQDAAAVFSLGRRTAIARRAFVSVVIDTAAGVVLTRTGGAVILVRGLRTQYGVRLAASRDSM